MATLSTASAISHDSNKDDDPIILQFTDSIIQQALAISETSNGRYTCEDLIERANGIIESRLKSIKSKIESVVSMPKKSPTKIAYDMIPGMTAPCTLPSCSPAASDSQR
jgi:hypothetical protein